MAERFDLVRLAELRDSHRAKVETYRRSGVTVRDASQAATRARLDAPPLPGKAPAVVRHAFAPGIGQAPPPAKPRANTNEFYFLPLHDLQAVTQAQLDAAQVDHGALARIIAAEKRLARLRSEHAQHATAVRDSADFMRGIELFSREKRL